jgi:phosphohistidine phosphatase SixA
VTRLVLLATVALALALPACGGGAGEDETPGAEGPQAVGEALRGGGHVLYLRHAATDRTERDALGAPLEDCGRQRNLTDAGREQARRIGEALRRLQIPTGQVVSSEYCRSLETARLAFDRVVPEPLLSGLPPPGEDDYDERVAALRELLGEPPPGTANRVVVGHSWNLEAAADVSIDEGETAVFEPLGGGEFRFAGRIPAAVWPQLADELADG